MMIGILAFALVWPWACRIAINATTLILIGLY